MAKTQKYRGLRFQIVDDQGHVYVDEYIDDLAGVEPTAERHGQLASDLADAGVGTWLVVTDPDELIPDFRVRVEGRRS